MNQQSASDHGMLYPVVSRPIRHSSYCGAGLKARGAHVSERECVGNFRTHPGPTNLSVMCSYYTEGMATAPLTPLSYMHQSR